MFARWLCAGSNTHLNCYRDAREIEKNKVFILLCLHFISLRGIQNRIILEELIGFFLKGHLKSIMPIVLTRHAQITSNLGEPETMKSQKEAGYV